jgi:WD40 repeat protein
LYGDSYPTAALSYAIKSLEVLDTTDARMFAINITQQAPPAFIMPANQKDGLEAYEVDFSPDGKWIAVSGFRRTQIRSINDNDSFLLHEYSAHAFSHCSVRFGTDNRSVYTVDYGGDFRSYSVPSGNQVGKWKLVAGEPWIIRNSNGIFIFMQDEKKLTAYFVRDQNTKPEQLGEIPETIGSLALTLTDLLYTAADLKKVYVRPLKNLQTSSRILVEYSEEILEVATNPDGSQFATISRSGEIRIFRSGSNKLLRIMQSPSLGHLSYDPSGKKLAAYGMLNGCPTIHIWNLTDPTGSLPLALSRADITEANIGFTFPYLTFHPSGKWIVSSHLRDVAFWPLATAYPKTLIGQEYILVNVAFTPDGQSLLSASQSERMRSWPLSGRIEDQTRIILQQGFVYPHITIDAPRKRFAVTAGNGRVLIANFDGTNVRTLEGFSTNAELHAVAFSADGRLVASAPWSSPEKEKVLRVWNVESGQSEIICSLAAAGDGFKGAVSDIAFLADNRVLVSARGGLQVFDLRKRSRKLLSEKFGQVMAVSKNHGVVIFPGCDEFVADTCKYLRVTSDSDDVKMFEFQGGTIASLDPTDQILITADHNGLIRVGRLSGGSPHLLFAHKSAIHSLSISPDGRWIASGESHDKIRLTPMPNLSKPAPHTLPYDQFLAKLKSFTNLRVVPDSRSSTGWKLEVDKFPGWEKVPEW